MCVAGCRRRPVIPWKPRCSMLSSPCDPLEASMLDVVVPRWSLVSHHVVHYCSRLRPQTFVVYQGSHSLLPHLRFVLIVVASLISMFFELARACVGGSYFVGM